MVWRSLRFVAPASPSGHWRGNQQPGDYVTIAYGAATGTRLWLARHNGPRNGSDGGTSVVASPDGSTVFVTGSAWRPGSGHDYLTMAYGAATGTKLWLTRYNGPANSETAPSRRP